MHIGIQVHRCSTSVQVYNCLGVQVSGCTGVQMYGCTGLVYRCTSVWV